MAKLLIADDSVPLLETLRYILQRNGYEVKTLSSADNIQQEINDFQPDLLIIDIFLGDDDGRDICQQIRKINRNSDLKILLFSAFPQHLQGYKSYGADDFIEKPFELKNLMEKIKSILCHQLVSSAVM
ncbi:MAG: response regulator [Ginsengibacter sp.]